MGERKSREIVEEAIELAERTIQWRHGRGGTDVADELDLGWISISDDALTSIAYYVARVVHERIDVRAKARAMVAEGIDAQDLLALMISAREW